MDTRRLIRDATGDLSRFGQPRGEARSLILLGCQRSGTNAFISCFENDREAKVFQERCRLNLTRRRVALRRSRRYSLRLRPLDEVRARILRLRYPLVVLKPLVESHRIGELARELPRARVVWLFRHYRDVAESNARTFGGDVHRRNLEPIVAGDPANWRSTGASEEVRETVARIYDPDMEPLDGGALFWWARNRLLFDQGEERAEYVLPIRYARFVDDPGRALAETYAHIGLPFPGPELTREITPRFRGRADRSTLSDQLIELCEPLWKRLCALDEQSRTRDGRSAAPPAPAA